ncbi:MAG: hypothetical protein KKF62_10315 [Bacteroidetes bacterium]|nr:hypothetical protein [Bacteroidota bacterium]MBU1115494.1 hypothetical protein [Bacteroidota bacterium]MBU1798171.1 hypothetical protein [Bacteroidota bacterium]
MDFDLVVSKNCCACTRAEKDLEKFIMHRDFIKFKKVLQNKSKYETVIVPSLFIDGKLFSYGEIDLIRLEKKMISLLKKVI